MRKLSLVALAVALAASVAPARAVPPILAGAFATDNVDFVANLPDVPAVGAKIVGDLMYVTTTLGLRIYDISLGIPVPVGALQLPHFENEQVDTNGKVLLIAADHFFGFPSVVYVIDVSIPQAPLVRSVVSVRNAHTATCIQDCRWAWTTGGDVIDLADLGAARSVGRGAPGGHNVSVDAAGWAWSDGSAAFDVNEGAYTIDNIFTPTMMASAPLDGFGWHNSMRPDADLADPALLGDAAIDPGEVVLGTDENWLAAGNGLCTNDGPFITSWMHGNAPPYRVERLDTFTIGRGMPPDAKPAGYLACSSHWFDERDDVVADAWYEQGVRFLDVSNPREIRQIGYFMPVVTEAWAAYYHEVTEGPLPGLYVYVTDYERGIDVLRFTGKAGDPTQLATSWNPVAGMHPGRG